MIAEICSGYCYSNPKDACVQSVPWFEYKMKPGSCQVDISQATMPRYLRPQLMLERQVARCRIEGTAQGDRSPISKCKIRQHVSYKECMRPRIEAAEFWWTAAADSVTMPKMASPISQLWRALRTSRALKFEDAANCPDTTAFTPYTDNNYIY